VRDEAWLHFDRPKRAVHIFGATCCKEHKTKISVCDTYAKGKMVREIDGMTYEEWCKTTGHPFPPEATT
jgi:hypothetical protein